MVKHTELDVPNLEIVRLLGEGRGASVRLVMDRSMGTLHAEKVFKTEGGFSTLIRNCVYKLCFQSPFPYGIRESAMNAALFRRKVLRDLTEFWFGSPLVADASYIRRDESTRVFVLGTQYIEGRGPRLGRVDRYRIRRLIANFPKRIFGKLSQKTIKTIASQDRHDWEIEAVISWLDRFKEKFREAGFVGSEWQVDKALSVPSSNVRLTADGRCMLIDVESAFPAFVLPAYIWNSLKLRKVPLFDDIDFDRLHRYLERKGADISDKLGQDRLESLHTNVRALECHTRAWKESELAIFRHRHRLITDSRLRTSIRNGVIECWLATGQVSDEQADQLKNSLWRFYARLLLSALQGIPSLTMTIWGTAKSLGKRVAGTFRNTVQLFYAAFFSEAKLRIIAEAYTEDRIEEWQRLGRLNSQEAHNLRTELESPATVEYLKGFMVHLGLQALEPPVIGNAIIVGLAVYLGLPEVLAAIMISPALRTIYTVHRKVKMRSTGVSYRYALIVGTFPHVGVLAYPSQISFGNNGSLPVFLARCQASRIGMHWPLFGGMDSRIEHSLVRMIDWPVAFQFEMMSLISMKNGNRATNVAPKSELAEVLETKHSHN